MTGANADRESVDRFLDRRDEESFRRLYRLHSPQLYRVIVRSVGQEGAAEDVLQETWIRAVTALPRFRWESSLRTWLTGIAIRCCREATRTRRADGVREISPAPVAEPGTGERLDLERALGELPPGRREVLLLHDVEGFTHAEIGALLEIDEGTSKSQLSRARRQMRRHLAGRSDPPRPTEEPTDARE